MSMTSEVRDELGRVALTHEASRKAQLATLLRMAAELRVSRTGLVVEAVVSSGAVARYLRREIAALYGHPALASAHSDTGLRRNARYTVRVEDGGAALARQVGMIDQRGRVVVGLPPSVVGGSLSEVLAAWRAAFLAAGTLRGPGKNTALEITCPSPEVAYALASCARRLGLHPLVREDRRIPRVVLRGDEEIGALLTRLGAEESRMAWERRTSQRQMLSTAARLANLDEANQRRSARAAAMTAERVERALQLLGEQAPDHLADTGRLRTTHRDASLEELGQLSSPPMTKDAVAGRLRRLLSLADKHAEQISHPETSVVGITHLNSGPTVAELVSAASR